MSFLEALQMNNKQNQIFNFGYVNLDIEEVIILLDIDLELFNSDYKHYYKLGQSYSKFEILKNIRIFSEKNLTNLKEYGQYRDINIETNFTQTDGSTTNISTTDLIKNLRNLKENGDD